MEVFPTEVRPMKAITRSSSVFSAASLRKKASNSCRPNTGGVVEDDVEAAGVECDEKRQVVMVRWDSQAWRVSLGTRSAVPSAVHPITSSGDRGRGILEGREQPDSPILLTTSTTLPAASCTNPSRKLLRPPSISRASTTSQITSARSRTSCRVARCVSNSSGTSASISSIAVDLKGGRGAIAVRTDEPASEDMPGASSSSSAFTLDASFRACFASSACSPSVVRVTWEGGGNGPVASRQLARRGLGP